MTFLGGLSGLKELYLQTSDCDDVDAREKVSDQGSILANMMQPSRRIKRRWQYIPMMATIGEIWEIVWVSRKN